MYTVPGCTADNLNYRVNVFHTKLEKMLNESVEIFVATVTECALIFFPYLDWKKSYPFPTEGLQRPI